MKLRTTALAAAIAALALPVMAQNTAMPNATTTPNPTVAPNRYNGGTPTLPVAQTADMNTTPSTTPGDASGFNDKPVPANAMSAGVTPLMTMSSRARHAEFKDQKDRLEQALKAGQSRADYKNILEKNGYKISAINEDKPDFLEYEIVKGQTTYEVRLDFKDNAPKATKIDVTDNMWRADSTERMMKDEKYVHTGPLVADPEGRYSDRRYMKDWTSEKDNLEKTLSAQPMKPADYRKKLEEMGYKVTSVNAKEKDYVEYEVVKGKNSYEVQVDLDPKTQMGKKVDVDSNLWETDSTERAKGEK